MRQPRPALDLVDAEPFEPRADVGRQRGRRAALVVEDEHADAARLAVAARREPDRSGLASSVLEPDADLVELALGARPEERQRDVEILRRHDPEVALSETALPLGH